MRAARRSRAKRHGTGLKEGVRACICFQVEGCMFPIIGKLSGLVTKFEI